MRPCHSRESGQVRDRRRLRCFVAGLVLFAGGCAYRREILAPSRERVRSLFLSAPVEPVEARTHLRWCFERKCEIRQELGHWIPGRRHTLLVTVELLETCHAEGFVQHLLAVVDPTTHELLTPVYRYVTDYARRRILPGRGQDVVVYVGRRVGQGWHRDDSVAIRFAEGSVHGQRLLEGRSATRFSVTAGSGSGQKDFRRLAVWDRLGRDGRPLKVGRGPAGHLEWRADRGQYVWRDR